MNSSIFWIICIGMLIIGLLAHISSWVIGKIYKNKMKSIANDMKAEK